MHHPRLITALAALGLAATPLASTARAAPPGTPADAPRLQLRAYENWAFRAKLPADWKLKLERRYGLDPRNARWVFRSPRGNGVLRVNLQVDPGGDFAKVAADSYARLRPRLVEPKLVTEKTLREGRDDVHLKVVQAGMLRNDFIRPYVVARIVIRKAAEKVLLALTLATTGERIGAFMHVLEAVMDSFEYRHPKPIELTVKAPPQGVPKPPGK